jgi:hypothetical protein
VSARTPAPVILSLLVLVAAPGCMIRLGPKPVELKRPTQPPIFRLGEVTEEFTGSWAKAAKANNWGGRDVTLRILRQSEAAALFSKDPANLTVDVHLVSNHEDDGPRIVLLATMSLATLGLVPLPFHSEWHCHTTVTVKTPEGARVADYSYDVKGTYDIFALPPTMFTLGAAGLRGPDDGWRVARRMARHTIAEIMEAAETEYPRLAKIRQGWVVVAEQEPLSAQVGETTCWVVYSIAAAKDSGRARREYVLEIHRSRPRKGATPARRLILGEAASTPGSGWRWRDPETVVLYGGGKLWYPEWKVKSPHDQLAAVAFKQRTVTAAELFRHGAFPDLPPGDFNDYLIEWKNRELPAVLRAASAAELRGHLGCIERAILKANEAAEAEKDKAQKLVAAGKPGAERHTQTARAYVSRIAILKPILAALKAEIANRQR